MSNLIQSAKSIAEIQTVVGEYYDLSREDILSYKRSNHLAFVRHMAMFLTRKLTTRSLPEIGIIFNRDHKTVMYGCNRIRAMLISEPVVKKDYNILMDCLNLEQNKS